MRPQVEYNRVMALLDEGLNDCEISRRTGIPRETVRDWRVAKESGSPGRTKSATARQASFGGEPGKPCRGDCGARNQALLVPTAYSYLLGQYLGDGNISGHPRGVYKLRITCTEIYPEIINEVATAIVAIRGEDSVGFVERTGCVEVYSSWKHWPCLLPQHGPGPKHERPIELVHWQRMIVHQHPDQLLRGLIHSDGNRHVNEIVRPLKDGPKRYRYPRYMFTNASEDILGIFTDACDRLGIHWTQANARNVAVSRREDVAYLDTFIGPKR